MALPNSSDSTELSSWSPLRALSRTRLAGAAVMLGTGLACFLAQWVAVLLWVPPAQLSTVWIPGGLMLAFALISEPRRWPAVVTAAAAGSVLLYLTLGLASWPTAILLGLLAALQTAALAALLRAILRRRLALASLREFLIYLVVIVIGGAVVGSLLVLAAWVTEIRPATFLTWRTLALAAVLGYLTMTPTVVLLLQGPELLSAGTPRRRIEAALLVLLLVLASGFVFSGTLHRSLVWAGFAMALPPLLLWAAMRFGTLGASAALLLVSVISTASTSRGLGPFSSQSAGDNTLSLQLFILGIGVPLLGLAVVLGEQERMTAALRSSQIRLRGLNRELIHAREEEATRIGRELHDDLGQRLALVSIGLSRLRQAHTETRPGPVPDIGQLQEQTSSIARSLREISHQLHPVALEHAGLSAAIALTCEEVRHATKLDLRLVTRGDTSMIPREVALCLYRVAQEALANVIRHSGARSVELSLHREGSELLLEVTDDGQGFAPGERKSGTGIGLLSATERVRAVGGALTVISQAGAGTTVRVAVPLRETQHA